MAPNLTEHSSALVLDLAFFVTCLMNIGMSHVQNNGGGIDHVGTKSLCHQGICVAVANEPIFKDLSKAMPGEDTRQLPQIVM